jgi:hypothetical protein
LARRDFPECYDGHRRAGALSSTIGRVSTVAVQRFCNALPTVPACTAPYRLVAKIRHFVAILRTVHSAESHPVSASSVGNPVGSSPSCAWGLATN